MVKKEQTQQSCSPPRHVVTPHGDHEFVAGKKLSSTRTSLNRGHELSSYLRWWACVHTRLQTSLPEPHYTTKKVLILITYADQSHWSILLINYTAAHPDHLYWSIALINPTFPTDHFPLIHSTFPTDKSHWSNPLITYTDQSHTCTHRHIFTLPQFSPGPWPT
jgi:hypothetical protein